MRFAWESIVEEGFQATLAGSDNGESVEQAFTSPQTFVEFLNLSLIKLSL